MLTEVKNKIYHYYTDEQNRCQGEFKKWKSNGRLPRHCFYVNNGFHGEYKSWYDNGDPCRHCFLTNSSDITKEVRALVKDVHDISDEEKLLIKLKWGIPCLEAY